MAYAVPQEDYALPDFSFNMFLPGNVIISERSGAPLSGISLNSGSWDLFSEQWDHIAVTWDATKTGGR